jgi:hypothetical protein
LVKNERRRPNLARCLICESLARRAGVDSEGVDSEAARDVLPLFFAPISRFPP